MKKQKVVVLMMGVLLFGGGFVKAVPITIAIAGNVTEISDPFNHLQGTINVGDAVEGFYVYDSETDPVILSTSIFRYNYTENLYGMDLTVGSTRFFTNPADVDLIIDVADDALTPTDSYYDGITIQSNNNLTSNSSLTVGWMRWLLYDYSHQALTSTDLPLTSPTLSDWEFNELQISEDSDYYFPDNNYIIKIQITSAVPEPTTIIFSILGTAMLGLKRKKI